MNQLKQIAKIRLRVVRNLPKPQYLEGLLKATVAAAAAAMKDALQNKAVPAASNSK